LSAKPHEVPKPHERGPAALSGLLDQVLRRLPSHPEQQHAVEDLATWLRDQVGDHKTHHATFFSLAWDVVQGRVPHRELDTLMKSFRRAELAGQFAPGDGGRYFCTSVKNLRQRLGILKKKG
jgi:hypothetical protein